METSCFPYVCQDGDEKTKTIKKQPKLLSFKGFNFARNEIKHDWVDYMLKTPWVHSLQLLVEQCILLRSNCIRKQRFLNLKKTLMVIKETEKKEQGQNTGGL